eukprot:3857889-Amphidinium_carterae.2
MTLALVALNAQQSTKPGMSQDTKVKQPCASMLLGSDIIAKSPEPSTSPSRLPSYDTSSFPPLSGRQEEVDFGSLQSSLNFARNSHNGLRTKSWPQPLVTRERRCRCYEPDCRMKGARDAEMSPMKRRLLRNA